MIKRKIRNRHSKIFDITFGTSQGQPKNVLQIFNCDCINVLLMERTLTLFNRLQYQIKNL